MDDSRWVSGPTNTYSTTTNGWSGDIGGVEETSTGNGTTFGNGTAGSASSASSTRSPGHVSRATFTPTFSTSTVNVGSTSPRRFNFATTPSPRSSSWFNRPRFHNGRHKPTYDNFLTATEYTPLRTELAPTTRDNALKVLLHDFHYNHNREEHHTDEYEDPKLIVRRGQPFRITLHLSRDVDVDEEFINLQFTTGKTPKKSKNTLIQTKSSAGFESGKWGTKIIGQTDKSITFYVLTAPDAIIGKYDVFVNMNYLKHDGSKKFSRYKIKEQIVLLFNAWCSEDQVYMADEKERQEYVLNETGRVYVGTEKKISGRPWNFGQFEDVCLDATLYLLETSYLGVEAWGNATLVIRALSAMANNNDGDDGVLIGNWSGKYTGGKSPAAWNGSVAILEEYMLDKRGVKYGQCWVFSGLCTTLGRTIGIPSRSVTNFASAHDKNNSMTIDEHRNPEGRPLPYLGDDSIWNFHVWNECYLKRHDLPEGNDGWQAFDATPQESSEGIMRCGPAPLSAIREGNVFLGHDTPFIFAEVNGDYIVWRVDIEGNFEPISSSINSVGKFISTKEVNTEERNDITSLYKHPEGSEEERTSISRAATYSSRKSVLNDIYEAQRHHEVAFEFSGECAKNGDIDVELKLTNKVREPKEVDIRMYAHAKYYTGIPGEEIENFMNMVELGPREEKSVTWKLYASRYISRLDEDASLSVYAYGDVKNSTQFFSDSETYEIDKPDIDITVESRTVEVGTPFDVTLSFTNPLDQRLTNCTMSVEGPGISKALNVPIKRVLGPDEKVRETVTLTPRMKGKREIIASLHSKEISGVSGAAQVVIKSKNTAI